MRQSVESLEGRRLLASVTSGVLNLNGTGGADSFTVTKNGTNLSVVQNGGTAQLFPISSVTLINVSLAGGNDTLNIANNITIPSFVLGGAGDDGIITGGGADTIDPGDGNDYIDGRDGLDTVQYASRSTPITGNINVSFQYAPYGGPGTFASYANGTAGSGSEKDTFTNVETLGGSLGNDTLTVTAGRFNNGDGAKPVPITVKIFGNGGDDQLTATPSMDSYHPQPFPFEIDDGGDGNDTLVSHGEIDTTTLVGGNGDDYFAIDDDEGAVIDAGPGIDTFDDSDLPATHGYVMPAGLENLYYEGSGGAIIGNDLPNQIMARSASSIDGGGGDDVITTYHATVHGGAGNDTINSVDDGQLIDGGDDNDTINLTFNYSDSPRPSTTVLGGSGNDVLNLTGDTLSNVVYTGGTGINTLSIDTSAGIVAQTFELAPTAVVQSSTTGNELARTTFSGVSSLTLKTGSGDDYIFEQGQSTDPIGFAATIDAGDGNDEVFVRAASTIFGGSGRDSIYGGQYADSINGGDDSDEIFPGGENAFYGAAPATDTVNGGAGADLISMASYAPSSIILQGGDDQDMLDVDENAFKQGATYTVATDGLHMVDAAGNAYSATFTHLKTLIVLGLADEDGGPGDHFIVNGFPASTGTVLLEGTAAADTLVVNDMPSTSTLEWINEYTAFGEDNLSINPDGVGTAHLTIPNNGQGNLTELNNLNIGKGGFVSLNRDEMGYNRLWVRGQLTIASGGALDLGNNALVVDPHNGVSQIDAITALINRGRAGGSWTGDGIRSSLAATDGQSTVGVAVASQIRSIFPNSFDQIPIDATSVCVRVVTEGDLNLDGYVNFNDLVILAQHYGMSGQSYANGNADYSADGKVDFSDLVLLAQHYSAFPATVAKASVAAKKPVRVVDAVLS